MASSCPTTRLRSWFSRSSACLPVLWGSSNVSFGILHLLPAPSGSLAFCGGASLKNLDLRRREGGRELGPSSLPGCGLRHPGTVYKMQPRVSRRAASGGCLHRTPGKSQSCLPGYDGEPHGRLEVGWIPGRAYKPRVCVVKPPGSLLVDRRFAQPRSRRGGG